MSEYWKSTPSYWCKFCSHYVKDTSLERKNHEASGKHQNNIQRSLRDLHKSKDREERDKQRAKDEVARLNGLVGGEKSGAPGKASGGGGGILGARTVTTTAPKAVSSAAQRKAHAEQLAALGVELPEELKREVQGVGGWQMVSERLVETDQSNGRSLADIVKREDDERKDLAAGALSRGVHKRKAEDDEDEEIVPKRKAWGSTFKSYKGDEAGDGHQEDLEALLSGVSKKYQVAMAKEEPASEVVKNEEPPEQDEKPLSAVPDIDAPVKHEEGDEAAPVVFKKRKVKK